MAHTLGAVVDEVSVATTMLVPVPTQLTLGGVSVTDGVVGHVDGGGVVNVGPLVTPPTSSTPLSFVFNVVLALLSLGLLATLL